MYRYMQLKEILLLLVAFSVAIDAAGEECDVLRSHMSTKTLYVPPPPSESEVPDTCTPVQLNFAIRHAQSKTSPSWLKSWKNPYPEETAAWLAGPGARELVEIGQRLHARLSPLPVHYEANKFVFEHTWKIRTLQSAEAFAFGFFDGLQPVFYHSDPMGDDEVLRFYDNCPVFEERIDKNKSSTIEHTKYRESEQMHKNLAKFRTLSGFSEATQKDMEAAYAGCAFDVAVMDVFDQWCSFFDDEMLLSMDYFQDLKHFYRKSHGNAMSTEIAAPLLQDMFRTMKQRVDGNTNVEGYFRFAHAETIIPLASLMNISYFDRHASDREGHFRADTPLALALQRKFKSSELAPFAANIGFVLYECRDGNGGSQFKAMTLLNEREVVFDECEGQSLCAFDVLEGIFRRWIYEFDFREQCTLA